MEALRASFIKFTELKEFSGPKQNLSGNLAMKLELASSGTFGSIAANSKIKNIDKT
jgi:hypothetical protein